MFFLKSDINNKKKSPRQGCWPQKSGLGMHQNFHFQWKPIKKHKNRFIQFLEVGGRGGAFKLANQKQRFKAARRILVHCFEDVVYAFMNLHPQALDRLRNEGWLMEVLKRTISHESD